MALVVVGPDADAAGGLRMTVQKALGSALMATIAPSVPNPADPLGTGAARFRPARNKVLALFAQAKSFYYDDRFDQALDLLGAVEALDAQDPEAPVKERVDVSVWRAAVFLASGGKPRAELEASQAIAMAPDLVVDPGVFPPVVADLVAAVRARGLSQVNVSLKIAPVDAAIRIDDRPVTSDHVVLSAGRHVLVARAPGFRSVTRTFEAHHDVALSVALPVVLPAATVESVRSAVWDGASPAELPALRSLADELGADVLVLAAVQGEPATDARVAVWWRRTEVAPVLAPPRPATPVGAAALGAWASSLLSQPPPPAPVAWRLRWGASAGWASRRRALAGEGGGYHGRFDGLGSFTEVELSRGGWISFARGEVMSYGLSGQAVAGPSGERQVIGGGNSAGAAAATGWRLSFGDPWREERSTIAATAGLSYDRLFSQDLVGPGGKVGLFPSRTRTSVDLDLRGTLPLHASPRGSSFALTARAGLSPKTFWKESPSTTGSDPKPGIAMRAGAGAIWAFGGPWRISSDVAWERQTVSFSGPVNLPISPVLSRARVTEERLSISFGARKSF